MNARYNSSLKFAVNCIAEGICVSYRREHMLICIESWIRSLFPNVYTFPWMPTLKQSRGPQIESSTEKLFTYGLNKNRIRSIVTCNHMPPQRLVRF
jgi:hypothetical protein